MRTNFIFTGLAIYLPTDAKKPVMTFRLILAVLCLLCFASGCSSLKRSTTNAPGGRSSTRPAVVNKNPKFLDDISLTPESSTSQSSQISKTKRKNVAGANRGTYSPDIEKATSLQFKYALLLNTEVEDISDPVLFGFIDNWYGTRYCLGGSTKDCIDCSAFVQIFFSTVYGLTIPRTARDQYNASDKIAITKLKQGDLVFFNTSGGISHVGVYLQNNKFVHASTSGGVMINDLSENYYARRFIGAGRIDTRIETATKK